MAPNHNTSYRSTALDNAIDASKVGLDILIGGSQQEHDNTLHQVVSVLAQYGITVNPKKCIINANEVSFVGLVFNSEGIRPDLKNVKNLQEADAPTSKEELRSFLGMAGYSGKFIPNFASIVASLREAMNNRWDWGVSQKQAFEKLKSLTKESLLRHYVIARDTELVVDASLTGLGAVLLQRSSPNESFKPVIFKSRSLKDPETRYSARNERPLQ